MKPYGFIYVTENLVDGKKYIGQRRYTRHWENYLGSGKHLLRAIRKYGRSSFRRTIIFDAFDKEALNDAEINFVQDLDAVASNLFYNLSSGGQGSTRGFLGKRHSPETRAKMRQAALGHPVPESTRRAVSKAHKGRVNSLEARRKQAEAISGANHPRAVSVIVNGIMYPTISEAERKTGMTIRQLRQLAGTEKPNKLPPVIIQGVCYRSVAEACRRTGFSRRHIKKLIRLQ